MTIKALTEKVRVALRKYPNDKFIICGNQGCGKSRIIRRLTKNQQARILETNSPFPKKAVTPEFKGDLVLEIRPPAVILYLNT